MFDDSLGACDVPSESVLERQSVDRLSGVGCVGWCPKPAGSPRSDRFMAAAHAGEDPLPGDGGCNPGACSGVTKIVWLELEPYGGDW